MEYGMEDFWYGMEENCHYGIWKNCPPFHTMRWCQDVLQQLEADDKLLENVITGDESWVFQYDPETKQQSYQWKSASSPRPKKACMQCSQVKVMLITFFDHHGLVHHEFVPQGQTVNRLFYKDVLTSLVNKIRQT